MKEMSLNQEPQDKEKYGRRLIPSLVDELAQGTPNALFAQIPKSSQFADGLEDVTIGTFARAINRCASWIESTVGKSENSDTVAYIGPSTLRHNDSGAEL